jgi:hypothetical protein
VVSALVVNFTATRLDCWPSTLPGSLGPVLRLTRRWQCETATGWFRHSQGSSLPVHQSDETNQRGTVRGTGVRSANDGRTVELFLAGHQTERMGTRRPGCRFPGFRHYIDGLGFDLDYRSGKKDRYGSTHRGCRQESVLSEQRFSRFSTQDRLEFPAHLVKNQYFIGGLHKKHLSALPRNDHIGNKEAAHIQFRRL